jgi:hypothetical protein
MSLAADLRTFLLAQSGISTLVGTRIYRSVRNQNDGLPAIVAQVLNDSSDHALDGILSARDALVQIDCFAATWVAVDALATAVEAELDSYSGAIGDRTCQAAFLTGRRDIEDDPVFGNEQNTPRVSMDFEMMHNT